MSLSLNLSQTEFEEAQADVALLNNSSQNLQQEPVIALPYMPNEDFAVVRAIGEHFGFKVHCVEVMRFVIGRGIVDGITLENKTFISAKPHSHSQIWVIGHEVWHAGERLLPKAFDEVIASVVPKLEPTTVAQRRKFESYSDMSEGHIQREVLADINGEFWIDIVFWRELHSKVKNEQFKVLVEQMITRLEIKSERPGRFWVDNFVPTSDMVTNRTILRSVFVELWSSLV